MQFHSYEALKKKIYGENMGIIFAWGEGIVVYWGFTQKVYDKTFWIDGMFYTLVGI